MSSLSRYITAMSLILLCGLVLSEVWAETAGETGAASKPTGTIMSTGQAIESATENGEQTGNTSVSVEDTVAVGIDIKQNKQIILSKNIFRPGRVPVVAAASPSLPEEPDMPTTLEAVLPKLRRAFQLLAFDRTEQGPRAYLQFENPTENRAVMVGDVIEFVKILEITPPYIRCDYNGREVRIDIGESSNDAYARLMGLGSDYHLIGTTVKPTDSFARFYFPKQGTYRNVEVGDILGNARIIGIERGRVHLRQDDGTEFTIKTSSIPRP